MGVWIQKNICILLPGKERLGDYRHLPISRRFSRKQAAFHTNTPYCGTQVFQGKNSTGRTKGVKKVLYWIFLCLSCGELPVFFRVLLHFFADFVDVHDVIAVFSAEAVVVFVNRIDREDFDIFRNRVSG